MCLCSSQCYVMCVSVTWRSSMFSSWCWPSEIPCAILIVLFILFLACSCNSCLEEAWCFFIMQPHSSFFHWFLRSELGTVSSRNKMNPWNASYAWVIKINMFENVSDCRKDCRKGSRRVAPYKRTLGSPSRQIIPNNPQFILQTFLAKISKLCWACLSDFFLFSCRTLQACLMITIQEHVKSPMFTASIRNIRPIVNKVFNTKFVVR